MNLLDSLISNKLVRLKYAITFMLVAVVTLPVFSQHDDHIDESLLSTKSDNKFQVT